MRSIRNGIAVLALAYAASAVAAPKGPPIQIGEAEGKYRITAPVSRLVMTLPKQNFERQRSEGDGATNSPRYFHFVDKTTGFRVSGWFEPAEAFTDTKTSWKKESDAWFRKGLPEPTDVSFEKLGKWDSVVYDMSYRGRTSSHIRAHWVEAGTWIDVHLSLTSDQPSKEQRERLKALLKTIEVKEKKS